MKRNGDIPRFLANGDRARMAAVADSHSIPALLPVVHGRPRVRAPESARKALITPPSVTDESWASAATGTCAAARASRAIENRERMRTPEEGYPALRQTGKSAVARFRALFQAPADAEDVPIRVAHVHLARALDGDHPGLTARDLIHLACCRRRGVTRVMTFDRALGSVFS